MELVDRRRDAIRHFLGWAADVERRAVEEAKPHWSLRLENRADIDHAREAGALFPEQWWGVVVFTCFGSVKGARATAAAVPRPLPREEAQHALDAVEFPRGSVGHHRIQPAVKGAKKALVAASARADLFYELIHVNADFDTRYRRLRSERVEQWGRTTCFDLFLRAGALGVGGRFYAPDLAYLAGSIGPSAGFHEIFAVAVTRENATWAESVLRVWTDHWREIVEAVGAEWEGEPYTPGDFENALCIYQEVLGRERRRSA